MAPIPDGTTSMADPRHGNDEDDKINTAPTKKVKREKSFFDTEATVSDLLTKFIASNHTGDEKHNFSDEISTLRSEVGQLQQLQRNLNSVFEHRITTAIQKIVEAQKKKIPFLCTFHDDLWRNFSEFLTDAEFLKLEDAAKNFIPADTLYFHWEKRYERQMFRSGMQQRPGQRVVRFQEASDFAKRMEESARLHYDPAAILRPKRDYVWPQQLYTKDDFCNDFKTFQQRNKHIGRMHRNKTIKGTIPETEFFVRMTYRENDGSQTVLLEGFRPPVVAPDENLRGNYTTMGFSADHTFLSMRFSPVLAYCPKMLGLVACKDGKKLSPEEEWPEQSRRAFLSRVSLTVLACDMVPPGPLRPRLVVATGGYYRGHLNIGYLRPRPLRAYSRRVSSLQDCVYAGFFSYPRKFGIILNWGGLNI